MEGYYLKWIIRLTLLMTLPVIADSKPYVVKHNEEIEDTAGQEIYVVSHGWHTGFVVSAMEIQSRIPELKERFGSTPNLEFGWGDKGFYQAKEITTGLTLRALFWPTESVIHAVAVPEKVNEYFPNSEVEKLCLSDAEYSSLIDFISNSFYKNQEENLLELEYGIYGNSQFYKGVGDFYIMNTCNKWTAKGLKSAGMDIMPTFKLTASSIMRYLQEHNQVLKSISKGRPPRCVTHR